MNFIPERLIALRQSLGISKAAAARMLNMSAMGYGRYENGERVPSYQTVAFIAQVFHSSVEYLYGATDDKAATTQRKRKKRMPIKTFSPFIFSYNEYCVLVYPEFVIPDDILHSESFLHPRHHRGTDSFKSDTGKMFAI